MRRGSLRAAVLVGVAACIIGCGYQWVRYGGSLGDVRRVSVRTLANDSYEPGVELVVTDALVREMTWSRIVSLIVRIS